MSMNWYPIINYDTKSFPYEERDRNVFFKVKEFKTRIINFLPGNHIPECEMASHVIFIVLEGEVEVKVNNDEAKLAKNGCLITEPALISMKTADGARLVGIQINKH